MAAIGQSGFRVLFELVHLGSRTVPEIVDAREMGCCQKSGRADGSTLCRWFHKRFPQMHK